MLRNPEGRDFPGGPVVRTPRFPCRVRGSTPGRGTKILQATRLDKRKKRKEGGKKEEI